MPRPSRPIVYALVMGGVLAASIAVVSRLLAPPVTPPAYTEPRPVLTDDNVIAHTETMMIDVPLAQYNAWSSETPLEAILPGSDSIPSVVRTEMIQGKWGEVGARRRVVLADGHYAAEEILATDSAGLFRYQVWGYTNFARFATDYAIGEFRQESVGDQTRVTWTYSYHRKSPVTDIFLERFVQSTWAEYMRSVLMLMKEKSEQEVRLAE